MIDSNMMACASMQDITSEMISLLQPQTSVERRFLKPLTAYLLELSLYSYGMLAYAASTVAASSLLLARVTIAHLRPAGAGNAAQHALQAVQLWPQCLEDVANAAAVDLRECVEELALLHRQAWQLAHAGPDGHSPAWQNDTDEEDAQEEGVPDQRPTIDKYSKDVRSAVATSVPPMHALPASMYDDGCQFEFMA